MHYAEFGEDEVSQSVTLGVVHGLKLLLTSKTDQSAALLAAIKEYDANKWKAIGAKVGKPAKVPPPSHHCNNITDRRYRLASSTQKSTSPGSSFLLSQPNHSCLGILQPWVIATR